MSFSEQRKVLDQNLNHRLIVPKLNLKQSLKLLVSKKANLKGRTLALINIISAVLSDDTIRFLRNILRKKNLDSLPFKKDYIIHKRQFAEGATKDVHLLESKEKDK